MLSKCYENVWINEWKPVDHEVAQTAEALDLKREKTPRSAVPLDHCPAQQKSQKLFLSEINVHMERLALILHTSWFQSSVTSPCCYELEADRFAESNVHSSYGNGLVPNL